MTKLSHKVAISECRSIGSKHIFKSVDPEPIYNMYCFEQK